jgi:iron complex transport system substrate-binding protein
MAMIDEAMSGFGKIHVKLFVMNNDEQFPSKIICLTEECVEALFALGEGHRVIGVSAFVRRPEAALKVPKVSGFTSANIDKIVKMRPDLVLGYSDIQKDIARDLIERGLNVFISNHRSLKEVLAYILALGRMVGVEQKALDLVQKYKEKMQKAAEVVAQRGIRRRVYLEEWDEPQISGIRYFSELVQLCGGDDIFAEKSHGFLAKERFVTSAEVCSLNPEVILACWCGKKVDLDSISQREGWESIEAVQNTSLYDLPPEIFLQPGPALFESGIDYLLDLFSET